MAKQTMTIPAGRSIERPDGATSEFLIEYDEMDPGVVLIDGVMVSVEVLTRMIVDPQRDRFFRFERKDDLVTVHSYALQSGDAIYYSPEKEESR